LFLETPRALEAQLAREAERYGMSTGQDALCCLAARLGRTTRLCSGAEVVAFWHRKGVFGAWPDIEDSGDQAHKVRLKAERRAWSTTPADWRGDDLQ